MKKQQRNFRLSVITNRRIANIVKLLPANNDTQAIEEAVLHFEMYLSSKVTQRCEQCGTEMGCIPSQVRWVPQCDC